MDSSRRRPGATGPIGQQALEDYQPLIEWGQDPENHLLRVVLPDFRREELRVQVDNSGKIVVRGRRQTSEGKLVRLEQTFEVPKDAMMDKVTGRFEDGCLFLVMPRIRKLDRAAIAAEAAKLPPLPPAPSGPSTSLPQEKKEESIPTLKDKPNVEAAKVAPPPPAPKSPSTSSSEEKKEESIPTLKDKPNVEAAKVPPPPPTPKDPSTSSSEGKKEESIPTLDNKPNVEAAKLPPQPEKDLAQKKKEEAPVPKEKITKIEEEPKTNTKSGDHLQEKKKKEKIADDGGKRKREELKDAKETIRGGLREKGKEMKKEVDSLYKSFENEVDGDEKEDEDEDEGWLTGYGLGLDNLIETIKRNKRVIIVAVVALSVGFYVSRKLRSRG